MKKSLQETNEDIGNLSDSLTDVNEKLETIETIIATDEPDEPDEPEAKVTLVIGSTKVITLNLDPAQDYSTRTMVLNYQVFDPLYRLKTGIYPDVEYEPCLANGEPIIIGDGLEWIIPLRRGVKFHDGTDFNADAVKFSIHRAIEMDSYPAWILSPIDHVEVLDEYTIKIVLKYPYAALKGILLQAVASPVSPTAVEKMSLVDFQEKPIGTGPFKYAKWAKGEHVILERNEDYWNKDAIPKCDRLVYQIFTDASTMQLSLKKGDIDMAWYGIPTSDVQSLMSDPDINYAIYTQMYIHWMTLNVNLPGSALNDVRVRQAIAYSIDQDEISEMIFSSVWPAWKDSPFVTGLMSKPSMRPYTENVDISKAKQLLTEAGYPDGIDMTLWYTPIDYAKEEPELAVLLQQQLSKAGIRVHFETLEGGVFLSQFRTGDFESALGIMSPDWPDPDSVAFFISHTEGSYAKRVRLSNPEIDELVIAGRISTDYDERVEIYGKIQDLLAEEMCYVPLVRLVDYCFYGTDITGVESYYLMAPPWWLLDK